ncbi:restriction endonuclease subunit S [Nostoc sp. UHCC 0702]|nr:restriction endonuclease subunit S [Nostoc sp. UHCC 0702]
MKRYKPYSTYKSSGLEWLGEIPLHWKVIRLKHICWRAANYGANESSENYLEEGVRFLRTTDIDDFGNLLSDNAVFLEPSKVTDYKLADGDILISRSGTIGRSFIYSKEKHGECAFAGYLVRFSLREGYLPRFIFYFTKSTAFIDWLGISIIQSTISNVNGQKYANISLAIPPLREQQSIVSFLDCETTRIDTLITKKRELINLLRKKRVVLITQTITKGLDFTVPMKDSRIPWIGKIPQHWEVRRFKFMIKYLEQGWSPACENRLTDEEEWGVLKVGSVNGGNFNELEHKALPVNLEPKLQYEIKNGDILVSRANTKELLGSVAKVHTIQRKLLLCDKLYRLKTVDDVDPDFFVILLQSRCARYQFERDSSGASDSMQNISQASMDNFTLPLPPLQEQKLIVDKFNKSFRQLHELKEKLLTQIKELQKYRQSLITAAVTGKIDVREEVNRKSA